MSPEFFLHHLSEAEDGALQPDDIPTEKLVLNRYKPVLCPDYSLFQITPSDQGLTINLRASRDPRYRIVIPRADYKTLGFILAHNRRQVNLDIPLMLQSDSDPLIYYRGKQDEFGVRKVVLVSNFEPPKILRVRPTR